MTHTVAAILDSENIQLGPLLILQKPCSNTHNATLSASVTLSPAWIIITIFHSVAKAESVCDRISFVIYNQLSDTYSDYSSLPTKTKTKIDHGTSQSAPKFTQFSSSVFLLLLLGWWWAVMLPFCLRQMNNDDIGATCLFGGSDGAAAVVDGDEHDDEWKIKAFPSNRCLKGKKCIYMCGGSSSNNRMRKRKIIFQC